MCAGQYAETCQASAPHAGKVGKNHAAHAWPYEPGLGERISLTNAQQQSVNR